MNLYLLFVKIGAILLGGGYVILPILKKELVEDRKLITEDELVNYYAISQSLPGLIAINIAIFIGYKLNKKLGALIAVLGMVTVPYLTIILIAILLSNIINSPITESILWGVNFGVIVLIISSIAEMWQKSITNIFLFGLFCFYSILILVFKISPASIILLSIILGILLTNKGDNK